MQGLDPAMPDFAQRLGERIASSLQPSLAMVQSLLQVSLQALRRMPDPLLDEMSAALPSCCVKLSLLLYTPGS